MGSIWTSIYVGYLSEGAIAIGMVMIGTDIHVSDGLAGQNVKGLSIDSKDNVWVATTTGVSKISAIPSSCNEILNSNIRVFPNPTNDIVYLSNNTKTIKR